MLRGCVKWQTVKPDDWVGKLGHSGGNIQQTLMTKSLKKERGLSAPDAKVLRDIQRVGWHVTGVFARQNEEGPEWARLKPLGSSGARFCGLRLCAGETSIVN